MTNGFARAPPRRIGRYLAAAPILLWSLPMIPPLASLSPLAPMVQQWQFDAMYQLRDVKVPLRHSLYGIAWLDELCAKITATFGILQFHEDSRFHWQCLDIVSEAGALYSIYLLEATKNTASALPFLATIVAFMLAQLSTAGFILPMYLYVLHVRTRPSALVGAATQYGQHSKLALAVLPTVVLTFYVPHFNSFLRPDLTTRHWWNWIWQAFPVWGFGGVPAFYVIFSILFGLLQRLPKSLSIKVQRQTRSKAMRLTAVSIGMINVATYWYTMGMSGFSWRDIYVPRRWAATPSDPEEVLGLLIQADGICSFGSTITWLAFQIWDLKTMGLMRMSWARIVLAAVAIMAMFGPGALCWVGWMAREEMLASMASESSRPAHEKKVV